MASRFIQCWVGLLGLKRQVPRSWHVDRLREEKQELQEAVTFLEKLSEASNVLFSISRAQYDGFYIQPLPSLSDPKHTLAYLYMIPKFSSRCLFYITVSILLRAPHTVREVVNPTKIDKLHRVAIRHQLDPVQFTQMCQKLLRVWPLLP